MKPIKYFALSLFIVTATLADGFIIFPPPHGTPLSVKFHKVTCNIVDGIASTTVDQVFTNNRKVAVTGGRYVFPIPKGAAIDQFKVVIDGVAKTATIMNKEEARIFFTNAVKNSNQAALLEYTSNSAYSLEIGSLAPGDSRRLQLSYVEVLPKTDGLSRYLYPLNTEKFSMQLIDTVSITVNITNSVPITSVYSPSFPISIARTSENSVSASYISTKSRPNRDFDLYYKLSDKDISFHLFTSKKENEDGYFLMLITPKLKKATSEEPVIAKDIVFTIDQSGSMGGVKITQAREALQFCINRLLPQDYFNIVAFQSTVTSNAASLLPANAKNISSTREFVNSIKASGGTNISEALTTTLSRMEGAERPHYTIFLTDGQATAGVTDIAKISEMVNEANTSKTRIFSVGFGFNVNTVLLDKLSLDNGGLPLYCSPDQNIEEVISDLYKRIESPLLTSPSLTFDGPVSLHSITPEKLPDLFSGSEIAIYGRYKGQGTNSVILAGNKRTMSTELTYTANFPASNETFPFVPRMWATQQISYLMTKIKLQKLTKEDITPLVDSVRTLSLDYGIVTPYTSSLFMPGADSRSIVDGLQSESGKGANSASNYTQNMQQNSNASQTIVADNNTYSYTVAPQVNQMQNIGNKIFVFSSDSIWKDVAYDSSSASDTLIYGSDAYFSLGQENADLQKLLAVGNQAMFNYKGKNYIVIDPGITKILPHPAQVDLTHKRQAISIASANKTITISREKCVFPGSVQIFTIKGSRIAHLSFGTSHTVVYQPKQHQQGAGTYLLVYREQGVKLVKMFVIK